MRIEVGAVGDGPGTESVCEAGEVDAVVPVRLEVCDAPSRQLGLDPVEQELVGRLAEVRDVSHDADLINLWMDEIVCLHHFVNAKPLFSELHSQFAVGELVAWIERSVIRAGARSDAIDESAEGDSAVPVRGEVADVLVRDLGVDPGQEGTLGGDGLAGAADLVVLDQRPYEAHDQLELSVVDVFWACVCVCVCVCVCACVHACMRACMSECMCEDSVWYVHSCQLS